MAYFYTNEIKDIVFYGVNKYSIKMKDEALLAGKNIKAFIDRRAKEIKRIDNIPVYADFMPAEDKDCVIVALQNAINHDEIAKRANKMGYERIIYVPMDSEVDNNKAQVVRNAYNCIILNDWEAEKRPIAEYREMYSCDGAGIIFDAMKVDCKKYVVVRLPVDVVYTSIDDSKYRDVPLASFKIYEELFNYYESQNEKEPEIPERYIEIDAQKDCTGKKDVDKTVAIRSACIEKYMEFYQEGIDFAISCAPLAKLNSRGCFNLCEGHHRTMWLLRQGIYYLPLRISSSDYDRFVNFNVARKIEMNAILFKKTPISNPLFNKVSFSNKFFLIKLMIELQRKCLNMIKGKKCFVYDSFWGYYAFNFYRMNALKVTCYMQSKKMYPAYEMLEELYRIKLSWSMKKDGWDGDVVIYLGEIYGVNKFEVIMKALKEYKVVISNLSIAEKEIVCKEYNITFVGKLVYNNKMQSVYIMKSI